MKLIQRKVLGHAAALVANTADEADQIRALQLSSPIEIVPNGVHLESRKSPVIAGKSGERFPQLKGKHVILFLGRLQRKKGLDVLGKAFIRVASQRDDTMLLIVGNDEDGSGANLQATLDNAGLTNRALFPGFLKGADIEAAFDLADIFVLPSYSEGGSIAILEAMAAGLPVVISPECGLPSVAESGSGIIVETDPSQVAEALLSLIEQPDTRAEMGKAARRLIAERFAWNGVASETRQVYERAIETGRHGG